MLDTVKKIQTPEGVELELVVAGIAPRFVAWISDFFLKIISLSVISPFLVMFGRVGEGLMMVCIFLIMWFYGVVFEAMRGATPGKRLMGLRVVNDNGTPLTWGGAFIRNFLRSADILPMFYTFGALCMMSNKDFKRLGDYAAGTVVVYVDTHVFQPNLPKQIPKSPPLVLNEYEQRNIVQYAERAGQLSEERLIELAQILEPVHSLKGTQSSSEIIKYANWMVGRR